MDVRTSNGILQVFSDLSGIVRLTSLNGAVLGERKLSNGEAVLKVGYGGIYLITIQNEKGEYTRKVKIP